MGDNPQVLLQKVCDEFNIGNVLEHELIPNGFANESYFCTTDKGKFVIRFLKWQSKEGVTNELFIQNHLRSRGILTTEMIPDSHGKYILGLEGKLITVSLRIDGSHPKSIDTELAIVIGKTLASFHNALKNETLPFQDKRWFNREVIGKEIQKCPEDTYTQKAKQYFEEAKIFFEHDFPEGIIHADFKQLNMLIDKDRNIYIFDFEESEKNILVFDLVRTIHEIAVTGGKIVDTNNVGGTIDEKIVIAFLKGYNNVRQMTKEEIENIGKALKYVTVAYYVWFINNKYPSFAYEYFPHIAQLEKSGILNNLEANI